MKLNLTNIHSHFLIYFSFQYTKTQIDKDYGREYSTYIYISTRIKTFITSRIIIIELRKFNSDE